MSHKDSEHANILRLESDVALLCGMSTPNVNNVNAFKALFLPNWDEWPNHIGCNFCAIYIATSTVFSGGV